MNAKLPCHSVRGSKAFLKLLSLPIALEDMIQENPTGPTVEDANDPHK